MFVLNTFLCGSFYSGDYCVVNICLNIGKVKKKFLILSKNLHKFSIVADARDVYAAPQFYGIYKPLKDEISGKPTQNSRVPSQNNNQQQKSFLDKF